MLNFLADTLIYGAWLFIAGLGLTLIFGVLRVLNFAHGSIYAIGAYSAATISTVLSDHEVGSAWQVVALCIMAIILASFLGPIIERFILKWFYGRSEITFLFVTYALFLIIEALIQGIWGVRPYYAAEPYDAFPLVHLADYIYVGYDFFLIFVAVALGLFTHWLMTKTVLGHLTISLIENPEVSLTLGIDVNRIKVIIFSLGILYAVIAGALTAPTLPVQPGMGINVVVSCFAVIVIGGLGSIKGAAIGALIVAISRTAAIYTAPGLELFSIYLCMTFVLLVKPQGLFPQVEPRRI